MNVDEHNFFLLDYDLNVIVMTLAGVVVRRFKVGTNNFVLLTENDNESIIVALERENSRLVYYNISIGEKIKDRRLGSSENSLPHDLALVNCSHLGELFLISHSEKSIFVYLS